MYLLCLLCLVSLQPSPRTVLVLGPPESEAVIRQLALLRADSLAARERDVQVTPLWQAQDYTAYGVRPGTFQVILIGRDGGEKFRSARPVAPSHIWALIDAMPMRRREINSSPNQKPNSPHKAMPAGGTGCGR